MCNSRIFIHYARNWWVNLWKIWLNLKKILGKFKKNFCYNFWKFVDYTKIVKNSTELWKIRIEKMLNTRAVQKVRSHIFCIFFRQHWNKLPRGECSGGLNDHTVKIWRLRMFLIMLQSSMELPVAGAPVSYSCQWRKFEPNPSIQFFSTVFHLFLKMEKMQLMRFAVHLLICSLL